LDQGVGKCLTLICQHFQLHESEWAPEISDMSGLEQKLAKVIGHLLNTDMDQLMAAFYKIDLDERVFKEIITKADPKEINILLARQVIKRELLKVKTREKYKGY
jgi:hypothetical protein